MSGAPADSDPLMDKFLPRYDVDVVHAETFDASPAECYAGVLELDLLETPEGTPQRTVPFLRALKCALTRRGRARMPNRCARNRPAVILIVASYGLGMEEPSSIHVRRRDRSDAQLASAGSFGRARGAAATQRARR